MGQSGPPKTAVFLGWNGVGKTAIQQRIAGGSSEPNPTLGIHKTTCTFECGPQHDPIKATLELVDVGSTPKIEKKISMYTQIFSNCDAVIVVLEATQTLVRFKPDDVTQTKALLKQAAQAYELRTCPWLVFVNKCDREDAIGVTHEKGSSKWQADNNSVQTLVEMFDLQTLLHGKAWQLQLCSAVTGEGIRAGMAWLVMKLQEEEKKKAEAASR